MDSLRLFRGACRHVPFTFVHLRLLRTACSVRAHLDMQVHRANTRSSAGEAYSNLGCALKEQGETSVAAQLSHPRKRGSVLASLVSMALILDKPSRTFALLSHWTFT